MPNFRIRSLVLILALLGVPPLATAQSPGDPVLWPEATVGIAPGNPDLGFLNHTPAGSKGRVRAAGADLVFDDGSPARFWGANLQAYALFRTAPENIAAHARRLAALGFNLVRIHHHDSRWVTPNVFGAKAPATTRLDPEAMAMLDLWTAALRDEGIYVWLDLHVGREVTARDGIDAFDEIAGGKARADIRGFNYVSDSIRARMLEFQRAYLSHRNPHTGLRYAEDPAIIAVLITNENDLTHHFGNALLPDKGVPAHSAIYMARARDFAKAQGLPPKETWKAWTFGPSKLFLNDLERRFFQTTIADIRATGFDGLVATTNSWGGNSIAALPSLTLGTIIDVHAYGQPDELRRNPRDAAGFPDWAAAAQVAGMPLSVSEWNITGFPAGDRLAGPLRMAASAAYQGWDAPMIFGYSQRPLNGPTRPGNWSVAYDPAILAMLPAAALMYRQGHVRPAGRTFALRLSADVFYGRKITPATSTALRTLAEQGRLVVELPETPELGWLRPTRAGKDAIPVTDPDTALFEAGAGHIASDTGEIRRDFRRGLYTVDTAQSQLAAGALAGGAISLSSIRLDSDMPMAAVAVQSLDGRAIAGSHRIMISLTGRAMPVGGKNPAYRIEPLGGALRIGAPPDLTLTDGTGRPLADPGAHTVQDGTHVIDLSRLGPVRWLLLQ